MAKKAGDGGRTFRAQWEFRGQSQIAAMEEGLGQDFARQRLPPTATGIHRLLFNLEYQASKVHDSAGHTANGCFTLPPESEQLLAQRQAEANPVRIYLLDRYIEGEAEEVKSTELYRAYSNYCESLEVKPLTEQQFGREIRRALLKVAWSKRRPGNDHPYRHSPPERG